MQSRALIALVLVVLTASVSPGSRAADRSDLHDPALTLMAAVRRTLSRHPSLDVFEYRRDRLRGELAVAGLSPQRSVSLEVENVPGTGTLRGADQTEVTLSLSSVVQLGGKRRARIGLAYAAIDRATAEREARALDLLSDTTLAFLRTLANRERLALARAAVELAERTLEDVAVRVERGISPKPDELRARTRLYDARLDVLRASGRHEAQRTQLMARMGTMTDDFGELAGDLFHFGPLVDFDTLYEAASRSPAIAALASDVRLNEAALALEQSRSRADLSWSLGLRRLEAPGDFGLVTTLSLPLSQRQRSRGSVAAASAARNEAGARRDVALLELYALLFDAYQQRTFGGEAIRTLRDQTIPTLEQAAELSSAAYRRGRMSYLELLATQQQLLGARQRLIDTALATAEAGVQIERLSGESPLREVLPRSDEDR